MGKINFFNTETGQREQQLDTRGKYTLSIAYVRTKITLVQLSSEIEEKTNKLVESIDNQMCL